MAMNHLAIADRIKLGKVNESRVMSILNAQRVQVNGSTITEWVYSTDAEDMRDKIDAWALTEEGSKLSVQFKDRESGSDLGIAVLRPYTSDEAFLAEYDTFSLHFDRDMKSVDLYVVSLADGSIHIVSGYEVKGVVVDESLPALYGNGGFGNSRSFRSPGYELKLVTDKGRGYSEGQKKVVCYLALDALASRIQL